MEKLLHERLKDYSHNNFTSVEISGFHIALSRKEAELIANEIERDYFPRIEIEHCTPKPLSECVAYYTGLPARDGEAIEDYLNRYYIPRPCDDDGEPWKVDDPCIAKGEEGTVAGFDDENFINVYGDSSHVHFWCDKRFVKRPTPKVYDADGVEIKVGKKAWSTSYPLTGGKTVSRVGYSAMRDGHPGQEDAPFVDYAEGGWDYTRNITHERPVFDAQGERICRGDTVYGVESGHKFKVFDTPNPFQYPTVYVRNLTTDRTDGIDADKLTHREPDSFEKLRDEIAAWCASNSLATSETRSWSDRLTALIERGAK